MKNGEYCVNRFGIVRRLHRTDGSSSTQAPFDFLSFFDPVADEPIDFLHLTVGLRMGDRGEAELDAEAVAEHVKFSRGEVAAVVRDDAVWHAESTGDSFEELDRRSSSLVHDRDGLYPLGEFVDCHQKVCVTARRRLRQGPDLVESPLSEGPCEWYHHQVYRRRVRLGRKALACVTFQDQISSVLRRRWPVEA